MALSNLRREPRREIIEQGLGVLALAALLYADYAFITWLDASRGWFDFILLMFIAPSILFLLACAIYFLMHVAHVVGEGVCALMAKLGSDPRPKQRY